MRMPMLQVIGRVGAVGNSIFTCGRFSCGPTGAQPCPAHKECKDFSMHAKSSPLGRHVWPINAFASQYGSHTCVTQAMEHDQGGRVPPGGRVRQHGPEQPGRHAERQARNGVVCR